MTRIFSILLSCFVVATNAQSPFFRKHTLPAEFRNTVVMRMIQDSRGFMWLGTNNGLIRFDGMTYKQFVQDSTYNVPVTALIELNDTIWVGYENGLIGSLYNEQFANLPGRLKQRISGFSMDKSSRLWIATYGQGLFFLNKRELTRASLDRNTIPDYLYCIASDVHGKIWVGSDHGITVVNSEADSITFQQIDSDGGLPDNIVTQIASHPDYMLAGTESAGVVRIKTDGSLEHINSSWDLGAVASMIAWKNDIWVGSSSGKLIQLDYTTKTAAQMPLNPEAATGKIHQLVVDAEQNVWMLNGTRNFYSGNRTFAFYNPSPGISNVQAILTTSSDELYWSDDDRLYQLAAHRQHHEELKAFRGIHVISMFEDVSKNIWLGTFDRGLYKYNPVTKKIWRLTEADGIVNNNILSITGSGNVLWLATLGGVSRITLTSDNQVGSIENFTSENGLGSNFIYKVFIDSKERVWFATDGKGVTLYDDGKFKNFSLQDGLKSNIIYCITEDNRGQIWISTSNTGIYYFTGNGFRAFAPHNGLRDLSITSLVSDSRNNLLVVSREGIDVLNPQTGNIFYHAQEMGISEIDPNLNCYSRDRNGDVWFGTQNGLIKYSVSNSLPDWPKTRINKMLVYLQENDWKKTVMDYDENHISFDYVGFWYHDPEEVTYRIKLDGYDREWIDSRNRFITYPNLPPGDYTFNVQSSASNSFRGAATAQYQFIISKPFYATNFFYAFSGLVVASGLFLFIRYRERKLRNAADLKKQQIEFQFQTLKSQVNPHFLFNSFNTLISVIEQDQDTAVEYVEKLSDFYRHMITYREQDVILIRKELDLIQEYYFLQVKRFGSNFTLEVNVPEKTKDYKVPPLTLQLLVENAVKHNVISSEKPLKVRISVDGDFIMVANNLQRKKQYEPSTGIGLSNIVSRFKILTDQEVKIKENENEFIVMIPILK